MSEQNLEIARRFHRAFERRDVNAVLADVHPDVEVVPLPEVATTPYVGYDGVRRYFEDSRRWDELSFRADRFLVNKDCVAMLGRFRSRRGGVIHDSPAACTATVRHGKLARTESFLSWNDALERCGLLDGVGAAEED